MEEDANDKDNNIDKQMAGIWHRNDNTKEMTNDNNIKAQNGE